jgi:hypothetical protein
MDICPEFAVSSAAETLLAPSVANVNVSANAVVATHFSFLLKLSFITIFHHFPLHDNV